MFKRVKLDTPKNKALDLFQEYILEKSLTDDGSFELIPGCEIELNMLYEIMNTSPSTPHLTLTGNYFQYVATGEEPEKHAEARESRIASKIELPTPRSVSNHVSNVDHHSRWTRIINEFTRILNTTSPIICAPTAEGPVLEATVASLWWAEVEMLFNHQDCALCTIFIKDQKIVLQFKLL